MRGRWSSTHAALSYPFGLCMIHASAGFSYMPRPAAGFVYIVVGMITPMISAFIRLLTSIYLMTNASVQDDTALFQELERAFRFSTTLTSD